MFCISFFLLLERTSKISLHFERFSLPSDLLSLIASSYFSFKASKASTWFFTWTSIVFVCFSKALPRVELENLDCSIICFWLEGNISSPVIYSYLLILPDDMADIFAASLLILYCSFSSLIWSSIVMIILYTYFYKVFSKS